MMNILPHMEHCNALFYKSILLLTAIFFLFFCSATAQKATISEELVSIKTYDFDDPNPIATLTGSKDHIYPYFQFDGYSLEPITKKWNVVTLENDYIEVSILPEVGGKVWGAVEKSTGEEFFYKNEVLKFRNIALRGPWTSGGIEFNFGITGHAPTTSTPVDYMIKEHNDGSVSCTIGAMDIPSGTIWRVVITLPPDKAYFETTSYLFNPSDLHQSNYVWQNAAIVARDDLEFFYPGSFYIGHPGDVHSWPIKEDGRNLAWYKNNNFGSSKSYHVVGKVDPSSEYFGAYWHDKKIGTGNWSYYGDAPGKKLWIWAQSRSGGIWEDLLTDTDGQYVEIQSGRFFSQAAGNSINTPYDYNALSPGTSKHWKEIWFPLVQTPGISSASENGVLHVQEDDEKAIITFMALEPVDTKLKIFSGTETAISHQLALKPLETFIDTVEISASKNSFGDGLEVVLGDRALTFTSKGDSQTDIQKDFRPNETPEELLTSTAASHYNAGKNQYNHRQYEAAKQSLRMAIQQDPALIPAYSLLAELYYRNARPDSALLMAQHALSLNTYNAYANYIAGLVLADKNRIHDAIGAFSWAARSPEYSSVANTKIATIYLNELNYQRAADFASRALENNAMNLEAMQLLAVIYRVQNEEIKADSVLARIQSIDKLNHFARFERYLSQTDEESLAHFKQLIRNELPSQTYLRLASFYREAGRQQDATTLLQAADEHPTIMLWLAYLTRTTAPQESRNYLHEALTLSPKLIFPHRSETISILNWAREQTESWKFDYYLGLIYWHKQQPALARSFFNELENKPDFAPFYIMRAKLNNQSVDSQHALLDDLKQAHELAPDSWRSWHALSAYYLEQNHLEQLMDNADQAYQKFPKQDAIKMDYAQALLLNGRYQECVSHLEDIRVLPFEGAQAGRVLHEQALLLAALNAIEKEKYKTGMKSINESRNWPEHLGVGKPYHADMRLQNLLEAIIHQQKDQIKKTKEMYNSIDKYTQQYPSKRRMGYLAAALAQHLQGDASQAGEMMKAWLDADHDNPMRMALHKQYSNSNSESISRQKLEADVQLRLLSRIIELVKNS